MQQYYTSFKPTDEVEAARTGSPAFEALCRKAHNGQAEAQFLLGDIYSHGYWGNANLASRYERGDVLPQDLAEAEALYERACHAGRPKGLEHDWAKERLLVLREDMIRDMANLLFFEYYTHPHLS